MPPGIPTHYRRLLEGHDSPNHLEAGDEHHTASLINGLITEINGLIMSFEALFLAPPSGRHRLREVSEDNQPTDEELAYEQARRSAAREVTMGEEVTARATMLCSLANVDPLPARPEELPADKAIAQRIRAARATSVTYVIAALAKDAGRAEPDETVADLGNLAKDYLLVGAWMEMHGEARVDASEIQGTAQRELPGSTA